MHIRVTVPDTLLCRPHSEAIHARYGGDKNLVIVEGDHNSPRPRFLYDSIGIFLTQTLQVGVIPHPTTPDPPLAALVGHAL